MKISLITVCFNASLTIRDTIESVLSQTHDDLEYIIIDGCSTDGTMDIIQEYGDRISRVVSEADEGLYDAMNKGYRLATGEVIGILNSDDVFASADSLSRVSKTFLPKVDASYSDLVYVSEDLSTIKRHWKSGPYDEKNWRDGWVPPHPTFYARREVYSRFGGFNLSYRLAADYEILFRLLKKERISVAYLPEVIVKMRLGGVTNESVENIVRQNREIFSVWESHGVPLNRGRFLIRKLGNRLAQRYRAATGSAS